MVTKYYPSAGDETHSWSFLLTLNDETVEKLHSR